MKALAGEVAAPKRKPQEFRYYKLRWEPCFEALEEEDIYRLAHQNAQYLEDSQGDERMRRLDHAAQRFLEKALQAVPEHELPAFKSHHQKFYHWAQMMCHQQAGIHGSAEVPSTDAIEAGSEAGEVELLSLLSKQLPQVLRGQVDALSVQVQNDRLKKLYESCGGFRHIIAVTSVCMDKMAHRNSELNIIEIGAGTGDATMPILRSLGGGEPGSMPRFGRYTYTDVSPACFEEARVKFEKWDGLLTYATLDISADPAGQGFQAGSYDVVAACNVLHATPDIKLTMANVRSLLKPGGQLVLIEEMVFGPKHFPFALLPEWWLANDDFRSVGPLLSVKQWDRAMRATGFSGVDLSFDDFPGASHKSGCLMVTTAGGGGGEQSLVDSAPDVVVGNDSLDPECLSLLCQSLGTPAAVADMESADVTGRWCIFLGGMHRSLLSSLTQPQLGALQRLVNQAKGLLWVIRHDETDPESVGGSMAVGLARTIRSETGLRFATLDLGARGNMSDRAAIRHVLHVFRGVSGLTCVAPRRDMEFAVRDGLVCVPRMEEDTALARSIRRSSPDEPPELQPFGQRRPLRLVAAESWALDDLRFTDDAGAVDQLADGDIEIQVRCAGLNFRDVLQATGHLKGAGLGQECSGIVTRIGDALQATFACLAPLGRFIELGLRDITQNSRLEMAPFENNVTFASVNLITIVNQRPQLLQRLLRDSFRLFAESDVSARWPVTAHPVSHVETGLRALQTGQSTGKLVVQMADSAMVKVYPAKSNHHQLLRPDATYVVVGGAAGIGLDIASWLPQMGAGHLILVSRNGARTEQARQTIDKLAEQVVSVYDCRCDISDQSSVQQHLVPLLGRHPPVRGVVYGTMVLRDSAFENLSWDDYMAVVRPRVQEIWHLQQALLNAPGRGSLDFFIMLSSAASFVGNRGQAPYAASGTFMSALTEYSPVKMPFTSIDLPPVRKVGYLAEGVRADEISARLDIESIDADEIRSLVAAAIRNEMQQTNRGHCIVGFNACNAKSPAMPSPPQNRLERAMQSSHT